MGATRYYEDFSIGDTELSRSRQLDAADIRMFGACSSLNHRIHTDALYCAKLEELGKPVVPYSLLLNVIDAFFAQSISPDGVPTFHYGYTKFEITGKTEKNENFGILTLNATTYNQNGEVVIFHVDKLYVGRKKAA